MPGLPTGASASESMAMNLSSGQSQNMGMDVFDQDLTFDESLLYVLLLLARARNDQPGRQADSYL